MGHAAAPLTPIQRLELAADALRAGDEPLAFTLLSEVLAESPEQHDALHFLGILHHRRGESATAESLVRRAMQAAPEHAGIVLNLGNMLFETGRIDAAIEAYRRAIELDVESSPAWHNLGTALYGAHRVAEARFAWDKAIQADGTNAEAWYGLSRALIDLGDIRGGLVANSRAIALWPRHLQGRDQVVRALVLLGEVDAAASLYREWLAEEPDNVVVNHQLAALGHAATPERASGAYVETIFDSFAKQFDAKLASLGYHAPALVGQALSAALADTVAVDIADLGCGTGLCGPHLRQFARRLVGCDLSTGMLQQARARGCYDALYKVDLVYFLTHERDAFDVLACADTLCYFGPLGSVCNAARSSLRAGGRFVFTVEALTAVSQPAWELRSTGRYAHSRDHLVEALTAASFREVSINGVVLRQEAGLDVAGWLVAAS